MNTLRAAVLPAGRIGTPEEIGRAYVHLMEQEFATGSIFVVDGGGEVI